MAKEPAVVHHIRMHEFQSTEKELELINATAREAFSEVAGRVQKEMLIPICRKAGVWASGGSGQPLTFYSTGPYSEPMHNGDDVLLAGYINRLLQDAVELVNNPNGTPYGPLSVFMTSFTAE